MREQSNVLRFPNKARAIREITREITVRALHEDKTFRRALDKVKANEVSMVAFVAGAQLAARAVARRWLAAETRSAIRFAGQLPP